MRQRSDECRTEQQLQLQWLQQEVQRQGRELDAVTTKLQEQKRSLENLKAQLAVVMGSWRSEVRRDLGALIREIDTTNDTRAQRDQLRRQVEVAQAELAHVAVDRAADLTPMESKVWMLMGMKLSTSEIATVLDQPAPTITECRERISQKLLRPNEPGSIVAPAAGPAPAVDETPRRQATRRGGRQSGSPT